MPVTHTPVNLPNDVSAASMGANNIVIDGRTNSTTAETTLVCCLDPTIGSDITLSGNNLIAAGAGSSNWGQLEGTVAITEGTKGYYEVTISGTSTANVIGWGESGGRTGTGSQAFSEGDTIGYQPGSDVLYTGTGTTSSWTSYTAAANDIIMFAYDATSMTAVKFWIGINGVWRQSGDPATGSNAAVTYNCTAGTIRKGPWVPFVACHTITNSFRFSSDSWVYPAPTGFSALTQTVTGFGNVATFDLISSKWPAETDASAYSTIALSNGNRTAEGGSSSTTARYHSTFGAATGKWYWEIKINSVSGGHPVVGVSNITDDESAGADIWLTATGTMSPYPGATGESYGTAYSAGDVVQVAMDRDNGVVFFGRNGTWMNSATKSEIEAATTTNAASYSSDWSKLNDGVTIMGPAVSASGTTVTLRAASHQWTEANRPTGFKALSTQNLPTPTVVNYEDEYFIKANISHSNGSTTAVTLPKTVSGGAMVRIKRTDSTSDWYVVDTVRGANKFIDWNTQDAEDTSSWSDQNLTSTTLTLPSALASGTYLIECFYVGSYFQIKAFTGNASATAISFDSALSGEFGAAFVKNRTDSGSPGASFFQHKSLGGTKYLHPYSTDDVQTNIVGWNNTAATTTQITVGTHNGVNGDGDAMIVYAWANSGPYAFGEADSVNSSGDDFMVLLNGFPQTKFVKKHNTTEGWYFSAYAIDGYNPTKYMSLDSTIAAAADVAYDHLSNGFKSRDTTTSTRGSGHSLVWGAFGITPLASNNRAR